MGERKILINNHWLKCLSYLLIWPPIGTELNPKKSYYIKFSIIAISTFSQPGANLLQLLRSDGNIAQLDVDIANFFNSISCLIYTLANVYYADRLAKSYEELSNFEKFGKPPNFDKVNQYLSKRSRIVSLILLAIPLSSAISSHEQEIYKAWMETITENVFGKQIDFGTTLGKIVVTTLIFYSLFMTLMANCCIAFTILDTYKHMSLRWEHVKDCFVETISTKDPILRKQKFGFSVDYHNYISKFSKNYNQYLIIHIGSQYVWTAAILGCTLHSMMEDISNFVTSLSIIMSWLTMLFLNSVANQALTESSASIYDAILKSNWEDLDDATKKDLVLVLLFSKKPFVMTVKLFGGLSHRTFVQILKASYSWVALIASFNK